MRVEIEVAVGGDRRCTVSGRTNLPAGTLLMLDVEEPLAARGWGSSRAAVEGDGRFSAGPLGPPGGLPDGGYRARLVMLTPAVQPEAVKAALGPDGRNLRGPRVEHGEFGIVVKAARDFVVGGPDAPVAQRRRLREELDRQEAVYAGIERTYKRLEAAQAGKTDRPGWAALARELTGALEGYREQSPPGPGAVGTFDLGVAAGHLQSMVPVASPHTGQAGREQYAGHKRMYRDSMGAAREELDELKQRLNGTKAVVGPAYGANPPRGTRPTVPKYEVAEFEIPDGGGGVTIKAVASGELTEAALRMLLERLNETVKSELAKRRDQRPREVQITVYTDRGQLNAGGRWVARRFEKDGRVEVSVDGELLTEYAMAIGGRSGLSEAARRRVYHESVWVEDVAGEWAARLEMRRGAWKERCLNGLAARYKITREQLEAITTEALLKKWPPPGDPPPNWSPPTLPPGESGDGKPAEKGKLPTKTVTPDKGPVPMAVGLVVLNDYLTAVSSGKDKDAAKLVAEGGVVLVGEPIEVGFEGSNDRGVAFVRPTAGANAGKFMVVEAKYLK